MAHGDYDLFTLFHPRPMSGTKLSVLLVPDSSMCCSPQITLSHVDSANQ